MRRLALSASALTLLGIAACHVPMAPKWNADLFFPINYPDVALANFVPGGTVPPIAVAFNTPVQNQTVQGATQQVLTSQDLKSLSADIIIANSVNINGQIVMSVASNPAFLCGGSSANPSQSLTVPINLTQTAGDTTHVVADLSVFQNASVLYYQTCASLQSPSAGGTTITAADSLSLAVNLFATVQVSR